MGIIESLHELETKFVYANGYSYPRKKRFLKEHEQVLKLLKEGNHEGATHVFELHIKNSVEEFGLPANKTDWLTKNTALGAWRASLISRQICIEKPLKPLESLRVYSSRLAAEKGSRACPGVHTID